MPRGRAIFYIIVFSIASAITAMLLTMRFHSVWPEGDVALLSSKQYSELNELKRLHEISDLIEKQAINTRSREENYDAAARGMVTALEDRYAAYYTNEQYERISERQRGEYTGIGATIDFNEAENEYTIISVIPGSPSEAQDLRVGDILVAIDGYECLGMSQEELVAHVRGEEGTSVTLTVRRDAKVLDVVITRAPIVSTHVISRMLDGGVGVIRLTDFSSSSLDEFNNAIEELDNEGMNSLIIDLRDNPGGNLETVVDIADVLLDEGTILTIRSREGEPEVYTAKPGKLEVPIAVIINENSASASEVLAGAIQDHKVGKIIGELSFGKGSVQTTYPLGEGGWVKFTTAVYFTPSGRSVQDEGIIPDVVVSLEEEIEGSDYEALDIEKDKQLQAALDAVS